MFRLFFYYFVSLSILHYILFSILFISQAARNSLLDESSLLMYLKHLKTEYLKEMAALEVRGGLAATGGETGIVSSADSLHRSNEE